MKKLVEVCLYKFTNYCHTLQFKTGHKKRSHMTSVHLDQGLSLFAIQSVCFYTSSDCHFMRVIYDKEFST